MKVFKGRNWVLYLKYLKEYLRYPTVVFFKLVELPLQMLLYLFLWKYLAQDNTFDWKYLVFYYFVTGLLGLAYPFVRLSVDIEEDILEGAVFNYLVRPWHYLMPKLSKYLASMTVYSLIFIPGVLLIWWQKRATADTIILFVFCGLLGMLVEFFLWYTVGLLSFSQGRIRGVIRTIAAFKSIVSGSLFPIILMPELMKKTFLLLPFQCYIYAPTAILLGTYSGMEIITVFLRSVVWLVILIGVSQWMYSRGLKKLREN